MHILYRVDNAHMALPPIVRPYADRVKQVEEYDRFTKDLDFEAIVNSSKLKFTLRDHPSRESDFIIDEYLWESETGKMLDELRFSSKKSLIEKQIFLPSFYN